MRDYVKLSLFTGARRSNVQSMKWSDINLDRAEWRIEKTKNGKPQTVTLSVEAIEILRRRQVNAELSLFVFPGRGESGHLMEPKAGWDRILARAGIQNLRLHDLRRTFGSYQAITGSSLPVIGKSLIHLSPSTTAIYAHLDLDPVRQSVQRASSAIVAAAGLKPGAEVVELRPR